jgi:antitoxin component of MazEF toxin-antitoxin module
MIKTISKIGNSNGIIFDAALLELAHLKPDDELNVKVHEGGTITLTPIKPRRPMPHRVVARVGGEECVML